ncbi:hypothetical protein ACWDT6_06865 [Nocardia grenadensis]|uniref:hypothetical protein n=1 Tax=Nocardia grenadensis TaxID=931537 RepID=UPI003D909133
MTSRPEQPTAPSPPGEPAERPRPAAAAQRPRPDEIDAPLRPEGAIAQGPRGDDAAGRKPGRPGATRYRQRESWRTALAALLAVVITPVAVGIAANGAATAGRWWDTTDRWLSPAQSLLGAALLLIVAGLAAYEPAAAVIAGLIWGALPAAVQIAAPGQTYRLISSLPGLSADLSRVLHTWLSSGVMLLVGVLLAGAGLAVALRRRGLPG